MARRELHPLGLSLQAEFRILTKAGEGESPKWPVGGSAARSQDMPTRCARHPGPLVNGAEPRAESFFANGAHKEAAGDFVRYDAPYRSGS